MNHKNTTISLESIRNAIDKELKEQHLQHHMEIQNNELIIITNRTHLDENDYERITKIVKDFSTPLKSMIAQNLQGIYLYIYNYDKY